MKNQKIIIVILLGIGLTGLRAQEAIPATGGEALGIRGSASYSVGQVVYTTNSGTNGSIAQGVQLAYEIPVVSETSQAMAISLSCTVYPNPTTKVLQLKVDVSTHSMHLLSYQLYDMNGKLIESNSIQTSNTSISMEKLVPATYFLKVISNQQEVKTFKIIKN